MAALRHPKELHNITLEGMIEAKRLPGRIRNTFIGQIKRNAITGSYRELKEMASDRGKRRIGAADPSTG